MRPERSLKGKILYAVLSVVLIVAIYFIIKVKRNANQVQDTRRSAVFYGAFDTVATIVGYADSEEEFNDLVAKLEKELLRYNDRYDIYYSYTNLVNLKTINENAGKEPLVVDQEIIDLLKYSKELYSKTNGQTNIALGSVLKIWHEYRNTGISDPENAALPSLTELAIAAEHADIDKIVINEEKSTVYLSDSQMSLDVGSIGKGYAVQRLAEYAKSLGVENMLISVGGNICAIGSHADGTPWVVALQNPDLESEQTYVHKLNLPDGMCVVTSGDYQRYYVVDGKKYCHIIDPDTLYPAEYYKSVSVITDDSGFADALSTALFCMPIEEGLAYVNGLENVEAMWILSDGTMQYSSNYLELVATD